LGDLIVKRILFASSALVAAVVAGSAWAEEPIRLTVGGHFKEAYMINVDDDDLGELGRDRNLDGFFNDAEIDFTGSTDLDNGLNVGAHIELEGETDGDQIDEAYIWFAGGFGEVRIGSDDEALHKACVAPPGGSSNFSAFSPNQWASNGGQLIGNFGDFSDNQVCRGVDVDTDAQKIIYTSPSFGGFQLTASYTPNDNTENHLDGGGPHLGMPSRATGEAEHSGSVALNYGYDGGDWGMEASLGASFQGNQKESLPGVPSSLVDFDLNSRDFYQAGVNFYFGNFAIGVAGEYFNDLVNVREEVAGDALDIETDAWVAGIGASYTHDAWIFGAQYSHHENETDFDIPTTSPFGDHIEMQQDRVVGTVTYLLGPGMNLDASAGYTWIDADPELVLDDTGNDIDDYDSFEIGLGATVTF